jgi:hypothetical protein
MQTSHRRDGSRVARGGVLAFCALAFLASTSPAQAQTTVRWAAGEEATSAKTWIGRTREIEEYLKRAVQGRSGRIA